MRILTILALVLAVPVSAQSVSYNEISLGVANTTFEEGSAEGDRASLAGSVELGESMFHLWGMFELADQRVDRPIRGCCTGNFGLNTETSAIGAGIHASVRGGLSLFAEAGLARTSSDVDPGDPVTIRGALPVPPDLSEGRTGPVPIGRIPASEVAGGDRDGWLLRGGVRTLVMPSVELSGSIAFLDVGDNREASGTAGVEYRPYDRFGIGLSATVAESYNALAARVVVRF